MSDIVVAWNQTLVDEIDAIVQEEASSGIDKYRAGYIWTRRVMWRNGNAILRHYPELMKYEGSKGGRPKTGDTGEGGVTSYRTVAAATGYGKNTIKKLISKSSGYGSVDNYGP